MIFFIIQNSRYSEAGRVGEDEECVKSPLPIMEGDFLILDTVLPEERRISLVYPLSCPDVAVHQISMIHI